MGTSTQRRVASTEVDTGCGSEVERTRDGEPGRVLVVDDDAAVRLVCAVNLQAEGLHVIEAADGSDALDQMSRERPDLVLTDVAMPGLDGFELVERLRQNERTRGVPVIFLSAETRSANADRARALGALAYLTKPFDPRRLATFVAGALAGSESASASSRSQLHASPGGAE